MGWLQRLDALDAKVLRRRRRTVTVRQFLRVWGLIGFVLAVPVGVPCAVLARFWLPLALGVAYPVGWTLLCLAKVGWQGIKADVPWPADSQRRPPTR